MKSVFLNVQYIQFLKRFSPVYVNVNIPLLHSSNIMERYFWMFSERSETSNNIRIVRWTPN